MKRISVVTPVFMEEEGVSKFYSEVVLNLESLKVDFEVIFCIDPSTDNTELVIEEMCKKDKRAKMIVFSKRVGQDFALMAGLEIAIGDCVVLMDSDLQDPPSLLPKLIETWLAGHKVVLAQRKSRDGENLIKIWTSKFFYRFMRKFSDENFPEGTGDFRLLDRSVVNEVIKFKEQQPFMRAVMSLVGFESTRIEFERESRAIGVTKYSRFFGGYQIAFRTILNYSNILLKLSLIIGITIAVSSFLFAIFFVVAKIFGAEFASGVTTIVFSIWFLGGTILTGIGIVGLYIDKIFNEVKVKPRYIVARSLGLSHNKEL